MFAGFKYFRVEKIKMRIEGYLFSFILGCMLTLCFMHTTAFDNITAAAIYEEPEPLPIVTVETNADYSILNASFQNNIISTYTAECKPHAYIIGDTVTKYECSLFYEDRVDVLKVSPTGSMWPNLMGGGYIVVTKIRNISELSAGDIIVVDGERAEFAHRIIEIGEDAIGPFVITQGDNNIIDDGKFREEDIKSRVVGVLY